MAAEKTVVDADQNVLRGKKVNADWLKPAFDADASDAIEYVKSMNGKQVLLQSMVTEKAANEDEKQAIVWGPFTVRVYAARTAKSLCRRELKYYYGWACYDGVCLGLEAPSPSGQYLTHAPHTANMVGDAANGCERVIQMRLIVVDASDSSSVVGMKFLGWDLDYDHVGMKADGTPVTMWDDVKYPEDMYQWTLVQEVTPEPTAEPTSEPTIEPTLVPPTAPTRTPVPAPTPDDGHSHSASTTSAHNTLPTGAIVGIIAGAVLLLAGILFATMWAARRRNNKQKVGKSGSTRMVVNSASAAPLEPLLLTAENDQQSEEETEEEEEAEVNVTRRAAGAGGAVVEVEAEAAAIDDL